jgi:hypothetical protein
MRKPVQKQQHRPRSLTPQQQRLAANKRFLSRFGEDFISRLPKTMYERIAAMTDQQEINALLSAEFTRILDQMERDYCPKPKK